MGEKWNRGQIVRRYLLNNAKKGLEDRSGWITKG